MSSISNWFDKVLVPEWRAALKMLSTQWNLICTAAVPLWMALPEDQKASILSALGINPGWIVAALFVVGILARLKYQPSVEAEK